MKSTTLESFLLGTAFGITITLLALYAQKPRSLVRSIEAIAEKGEARKARQEEEEVLKARLRAVGFPEEEIRDLLLTR
jgi:hypothetical protein